MFEHPGEDTVPTSIFVCDTGGMVVICAGTTGYNATLDLRYHWMRQKRFQGSHFANDDDARGLNDLVIARQGRSVPVARPSASTRSRTCHQLMRDNRHPHGQHGRAGERDRRRPARHTDGQRTLMLDDGDVRKIVQAVKAVLHAEESVTGEIAERWSGGQLVLRPGKAGTLEKVVPIESFFRKIIAVREKLRVLEQRINGHPKLTDEDRLQLQEYITRIYGSLTTFNVLFADPADRFVGTGSRDES